MNRFLERQDGFSLSGTAYSCTKGIWMWDNLDIKNNDVTYLFMDTEVNTFLYHYNIRSRHFLFF